MVAAAAAAAAVVAAAGQRAEKQQQQRYPEAAAGLEALAAVEALAGLETGLHCQTMIYMSIYGVCARKLNCCSMACIQNAKLKKMWYVYPPTMSRKMGVI